MKFYLLTAILASVTICANAADAVKWTDPESAGAELHGKGWKDVINYYHRLPAKAKGTVPPAVWHNGTCSAGLSLVFRTDSPEIHIRYQLGMKRTAMFHMPSTGVSGVDLSLTDSKGKIHYVLPQKPSFKDTVKYNYSLIMDPVTGEYGATMTYTLRLPLYNEVKWLEIGIPEGKTLEFVPVPAEKPIVIYGSSITQGGCASRPAMAWPSIVATKLGREVINLGFSGSGKGEKEVFDLIAELDASVFMIDCLPNMTLDLPIKERLLYGVHKIREAHSCPILLAEYSICGHGGAICVKKKSDTDAKNAILKDVYNTLRKEGVKNIHYLGVDDWQAGMDGYVEGDHPNDYGMHNLAEGAARKLRKLIKINK